MPFPHLCHSGKAKRGAGLGGARRFAASGLQNEMFVVVGTQHRPARRAFNVAQPAGIFRTDFGAFLDAFPGGRVGKKRLDNVEAAEAEMPWLMGRSTSSAGP